MTCISGLDVERMKIQTRYLESAGEVIGVGGKCSTYRLDGIEISLIDKFTKTRIDFHIEKLEYVCVMDETGTKMPSLLGTDILQRFDICTDRRKGTATLKRIATAPGEFRIVSREIPKAAK